MKNNKKIFSLFLACIICQLTWSQSPVIRGRNMRIEEQPVRVSSVHIDVELLGPLAKTTVSLSVFNPNNRMLEGEFNFPLANGQSISRFAIDIDGAMCEGVAVDKAKAQKFFESVVRRNIDPGLIEKTQGNNFRTRIYPIAANGTRQIIIAYEQELPKVGEDYLYTLPFNYGDKVNLSINIEAEGYSKKPKIEQSISRKLKFKEEGNKFVARYENKNQTKAKSVIISMPVANTKAVLTETDLQTHQNTFYARVFPNLQSDVKILPEKIAIYWDTSLSMEDRDIDKEIELLDKYFQQINNAQIDLYTFGITLSAKTSYKLQNGKWNELKKALLATKYDGATTIGNLNFETTEASAILLFSDGIDNFGGGDIKYKKDVPVFAITSVPKADYNSLRYMSVVTGGKYIDLQQQAPEEAALAMTEQNFRLISAEYNKSEITDLAFLQYLPNTANGFSISGKLLVPTAKIKLNFGIGNYIMETVLLHVSETESLNVNNIIERIWVEKWIADLEINYDANKKEIEALGTKYNIVTRNTSLIVLDNVNDYVELRLTPPHEMLQAYNEKVTKLDTDAKNRADETALEKEKERLEQIDMTVSLLNRKKEWWEMEFPKDKPKPALLSEMRAVDLIDGVEIVELLHNQAFSISEMDSRPFLIAETNDFVPEYDIKNEKKKEKERKKPVIQLKKWNPDMPYMEALNTASDNKLYDTYLSLRKQYKDMPSFYVDVSILMQNRGLHNEALLVISNLAEIELENYRLLRVLAYRLLHMDQTEHAVYQFEVVKRLRPEEPQSFRDLALAYNQNKEYQIALDTFVEMIETPFDRFTDIKMYATEEMNNIIARCARENIDLDISRIDPRLLHNMPVDIRVMMSWDTDNVDIDLWVTDPHAQECYYAKRNTYNGGMYFYDITNGYGPETYQIREAIKGKYKIVAKYFANHSQSITGPTTIYLDVFTEYATDKENKETIMIRLDNTKDELEIGEVNY